MAESMNLVTPAKLHQELKAAGLPVVGVSSSGRIDYERSLTSAEKASAQAIIAAHDPSATEKEVFFEKLALAGFSRDDLLYVLWKFSTENNTSIIDSLLKEMDL